MAIGEIIQLEENGVPQFLKTHVDAVEGLGEALIGADTGWLPLNIVSGFQWHPSYPGQYRVKNNQVYLRGALSNDNANLKATVVARIPAIYAPEILSTFSVALMSQVATEVGKVVIGKTGDIEINSVSAGKNVYLNEINYLI